MTALAAAKVKLELAVADAVKAFELEAPNHVCVGLEISAVLDRIQVDAHTIIAHARKENR